MIPSKHNNCYVLIQSYSETSGQFNPTKTWAEFTKAWVSISPDRGREIVAAGERQSIVTHTIRADYLELSGVEEKMRVIYHPAGVYSPIPDAAEVYDIVAVMVDQDHRSDIMLKVERNGRTYAALS